MKSILQLSVSACACFLCIHSLAQTQPDVISLGEILERDTVNNEVYEQSSIAAIRLQDSRLAPGKVIVFTQEDIAMSGARDLIELLVYVTGFHPGIDIDNVIGLNVRGLWAHEGKCLFMLNGLPLNEIDFGTFALGNRIQLANVKRVEVFLGSASVIYGGMAALGAVNVITKDAIDNAGVYATTDHAVSHSTISRNEINLSGNHNLGSGTYLSYEMGLSESIRSSMSDVLYDGTEINFADHTRITSSNAYLALRKERVSLQFLLNDYNSKVAVDNVGLMSRLITTSLQYAIKERRDHRGKLSANYSYQLPWFNVGTMDEELASTNTISRRADLSGQFSWRISNLLFFDYGANIFHVISERYTPLAYNQFLYTDDFKFGFAGGSVFGEISAQHPKFGTIGIGARAEGNKYVPIKVVPRISYAAVAGRFNLKLLAGLSYKVPTLQNLDGAVGVGEVIPEDIYHYEAEIGYRLRDELHFTASLFRTRMNNPIVYFTDTIQLDNYINYHSVGSGGMEASLQGKKNKFQFRISAAYYGLKEAYDEINLALLMSGQNGEAESGEYKGEFIAVPRFKSTALVGMKISDHFLVSLSGIISSSIYTKYPDTETGEYVVGQDEGWMLFNSVIRYARPRFNVSFGCNNLLDRRMRIQPPATPELFPMPLMGREWKLQLRLMINKN